tara:strand:- start:1027 stop:1983 length:957 start_codon:yes stop_codon:yes gene_type:complete
MIYIILLFSLINSFKSIILSEFYSNFLIFSIYPLELSLLSFNNSFSDIILKWIVNGWFRQENEIEYINNIQQYDDSVILISWAVTYAIFILYILCKYRKKLTRYIFISYQLKFLIINYLSLFLWSFNILLNYDDIEIFVLILINVYIFNFITFWFQGILFNFIYGDKMYLYRKKYNFLINNFNPRYKYFTLIFQSLKSLNFIYMIIYNLYGSDSDYVLITINLINIFIYLHSKIIFIHKTLNIYLIILHLFSLIQIICSILDLYFEYNFIIKYTIMFFNIIFIIIFNYKSKKIIKKYNQSINELNELTLNSIELNTMV